MSTHYPLAQLLTALFNWQHMEDGVGHLSFHNADAPEKHAHVPSSHGTGVRAKFFRVKNYLILPIKRHNKATLIPKTIITTSGRAITDFEEELCVGGYRSGTGRYAS